jgi:SAM-dependent methyltransferase
MAITIDYDHNNNLHTYEGALAALSIILADWKPNSILDVGCGFGTWLKASLDLGISDIFGIDGVAIPTNQLLIPPVLFQRQDLTKSWNLGRSFDAVLCLEVAEHLESSYASNLIQMLTNHGDVVVFSAAPPSQAGQHHVNCQWPTYWQELFNGVGFACFDTIRWQLWNNSQVEPWYRQNMFIAQRNPTTAGKEDRIKSVIHPELLPLFELCTQIESRVECIQQIESGSMAIPWYLKVPLKAAYAKFNRHT